MKALCVRQPFAELIARGVKSLEIRSWRTDYRGPLLIVASSQLHALTREAMPKLGRGMKASDLPLSQAICAVDLVDIRTVRTLSKRIAVDAEACCEPADNDLAWQLGNPRRVAPFHVKGRLRLFDVADELIRDATDCPGCGWPIDAGSQTTKCFLGKGCLCGQQDVCDACGRDEVITVTRGDDDGVTVRECQHCGHEEQEEEIPACAASMGCLCAGHARGNAAGAACDTRE